MTRRIQYAYFLFLLSVISILVHSFVSALTAKTEWLFFGLAALSFIVFFFLLAYNLMEFIITKEPDDLWKLGFLGLFGLLGLIPGLTPFFALFSLFGLFGTKEYI
jgi:hypothetical protein